MTRKIDFYLDRFEGSFAVLLAGGAQLDFPRSLLPADAREGDFITFLIEVNKNKTRKNADEIGRLRQNLDGGS